MGKLTDTKIKALKATGVYGDGDRLYLRVQGQARSWLFIYTWEGRRRELGLGGYPSVSLGNARKKAQEARDLLGAGGDPIGIKQVAVVGERTLGQVAEEWIERQGFRAPVAARYRAYVRNFLFENGSEKQKSSSTQPARRVAGANPKHKLVTDVSVHDIERILTPLWHTPTGPYLRSFLERVFDFAMVKGYVPRGLNPAALRGNLEHVLPKVRRVTEHHEALPFAQVPTLYRTLSGMGADALRFTILTASRQLEVREMRWREVDLASGVWTIPADRYKTRRPHQVPLSPEALRLLGPVGPADAFVFPRPNSNRPLSRNIFGYLLKGACDPHGFRTSFAVWCVEAGGFADDLAQRCLGHVVGTEVTRAYQRSDFIEPRRRCLEAWAAFVRREQYA